MPTGAMKNSLLIRKKLQAKLRHIKGAGGICSDGKRRGGRRRRSEEKEVGGGGGEGKQLETLQMKACTYQDSHASIHVVNVHNIYKHNVLYTCCTHNCSRIRWGERIQVLENSLVGS